MNRPRPEPPDESWKTVKHEDLYHCINHKKYPKGKCPWCMARELARQKRGGG